MDGFTRYEWAVPLKDKKEETIANAFKLWVNQGKEFYNQHMYKLFKLKK